MEEGGLQNPKETLRNLKILGERQCSCTCHCSSLPQRLLCIKLLTQKAWDKSNLLPALENAGVAVVSPGIHTPAPRLHVPFLCPGQFAPQTRPALPATQLAFP